MACRELPLLHTSTVPAASWNYPTSDLTSDFTSVDARTVHVAAAHRGGATPVGTRFRVLPNFVLLVTRALILPNKHQTTVQICRRSQAL